MKEIQFYKMEASANDFVVIDNRKQLIREPGKLALRLCDRHTGIGSDGLLLVESSRKAHFKMRVINADGSEAEMCGNGSRCVALFAKTMLKLPPKLKIETLAGMIGADLKGDIVKVRLSDPRDFKPKSSLPVNGNSFDFYFINTGVPHVVIFVEDLEGFPVDEVGEKIRFHARFQPGGANANFVKTISSDSISVRTYERGVGETQACGTGATASALVSALAGKCRPPVKVKTRRGEILKVHFHHDGREVTDVYLEGKARFVFEGRIKT